MVDRAGLRISAVFQPLNIWLEQGCREKAEFQGSGRIFLVLGGLWDTFSGMASSYREFK